MYSLQWNITSVTYLEVSLAKVTALIPLSKFLCLINSFWFLAQYISPKPKELHLNQTFQHILTERQL